MLFVKKYESAASLLIFTWNELFNKELQNHWQYPQQAVCEKKTFTKGLFIMVKPVGILGTFKNVPIAALPPVVNNLICSFISVD